MIFFGISRNDDEETEEEDAEAGLDDAILDEIAEDEGDAAAEETEGFGLIDEKDVAEPEEEKKEEDDGDENLEDDAEDVDFDTFDDVDEM